MTTATFDLEDIRCYRMAVRSRSHAAASAPNYPRIVVDFELSGLNDLFTPISSSLEWNYHSAEEEIALGPAAWLWDYLRRSGQGGFFLPLSGGVDSSSTAIIIHSMCHMVVNAIHSGDTQVLDDVRRLVVDSSYVPENATSLCNRIFVTCYMGSENSSEKTRNFASTLASQIGSYHLEINIDGAVRALISIFNVVTGMTPKFRSNGGCVRQSLGNFNVIIQNCVSYYQLFSLLQ